ncbi:pectinesterase family protein [Parabacteroides sp. FAFU027]|uniref:pectinesterase family protein n=1 Tax=Parabacteroides sp. FAFU027 TaxID=2922715 RepID=UPI001FAE8896|nr:pectinesterase family protein [Parabacteroides sp. FAFU027]
MKNKRLSFLILLCFSLIFQMKAATQVNTTTTITWPFNLGTAGQVATYTTGTENYFSTNWVDKGSNLAYKDAFKTTNGYDNKTYTRFQPVTQSASVDATNLVSFNIRPATGMSFTPTNITFDCMRYGTDGGNIDLVWKSSDGTTKTIATALKPNRDNNVAGGSHFTYDLSSLSIPASSGDCALYIYIYNLGNTKQIGLTNIVINGNLTGDLVTVTKYALNSVVYPTTAGTVTSNPVGTSFDAGTSISMIATRNFGYQFKEWRDANTDAVVSTSNPYIFTLNSDASLKAVFTPINTYSLTVNASGGGQSYMISASPAGTTVNGQTMYEDGTNVTLTASNNSILTFNNWLTGETNSTLPVVMNQNQNITAVYSAVDYIVGWDFYKSGASGRPADFYSTSDNQASALILRKADGTTSSWLDKSIVAAAGYGSPARGSAVNWKPFADQYYYQISFSAKDFTDVKISAGMLYNYNAYSVQNCQYSLDGTNFTQLGTYTLSTGNTWVDQTFSLPADANHADKVYIRWIPDYTSTVVGSTSTNDGTSISNIYVTAKAAIYNDGVAPVFSCSVPAEGATNASTTGKVVLTFDEKVMLTSGSVAGTLGSKQLTPAVSGTTITFPYTGLDYNTQYTFTLPANSVSDLAGNTLTSPITVTFTTMTRPTVSKKLFDFVVGVDGDFKAAITAATAASASGTRFHIFFPNGEYNIGANTGNANQMTTITLPNVSYVGQSSDGVVLYNQNTAEGIGVTATMYFTNAANNLYLQDLTLKNKDYRSGSTSIGRCVALWDQGTKNIYKNVNLLSNQDTYYSGSGRLYFEGGSIHGTVDFICGGGDVYFNECLLYLENRSGNCITAPATSSSWGYVFNNCTIDGFSINNGSYYLGRPWQNSPKSVYINTKMNQLPTAAGWTEMGVVPGLFAEYNSTTSAGATVDLSSRKSSYTYNGVTSPAPNPVLTSTQAAQYTIENVLGGTDTWQPKLYTDAATTPVISGNGSSISWADNNYVLCWAIFKDGVFVTFTTANSYSIPSSIASGTYTVRAANEMGGLSATSNTYTYSSVTTGTMNTPEQKVIAISKDGVLHLSNLPAPCKLEVYAINGKMLVSQKATTSTVALPLSESYAIVRVISNNETTVFKVSNK